MKAVQWYEKASNQLPEEEEVKEALAEAWYQQGTDRLLAKHYEESISALSRTIELSPTHVNAYINRGVTYYDQKEYAKAIVDYTRALRAKYPFSAWIRVSVAKRYLNRTLHHKMRSSGKGCFALIITVVDPNWQWKL
ncbi:tetratricopeptide repeat protein [Ktedonospora formicarum]|uniref:Tetratricopeptide repeat protein n=1 Tax=Ktedonospora formicarum TaxID=2778364 RepID=A0A8J3MXW9_9CHLR|nr:tetratricopeptide repeat protein [Ktedonospora formicarum]GHO49040.1 hypothetical protein KSX_72030 [Ktedonospora formicarum]